jgi:hypothetical protein
LALAFPYETAAFGRDLTEAKRSLTKNEKGNGHRRAKNPGNQPIMRRKGAIGPRCQGSQRSLAQKNAAQSPAARRVERKRPN